MKGIILHGGHGTRLEPLTFFVPKQLLPIANKPMSQYALEDLRNAGINEIAIIVGDVYPQKVKEYYGTGEKFGVKITYISQEKPKGIAHAINLCRDFVGEEKFAVYLGDNILQNGISEYVEKFEKEQSIDSFILLCKVDDPSRFGIAELENKKIVKIVEKPKQPLSNLAVIGVYFFNPKIFDIIDKQKPSWRNELEVTDSLQIMIERGLVVEYDIVTGGWKDTGTPEDVIHANQLILDTITSKSKSSDKNFNFNKKLILSKDSSISSDTLITGPVIIGDNCKIGPKVRLGPYVSIGNNTVLKHCEIENSIIMNNCKIDSNVEISGSIISQGSEITHNGKNSKHQFLLGERSKLKL